MTKEQVCARIKQIGILPGIRVPSAKDALFAAGEMYSPGIDPKIVECTVLHNVAAIPGALTPTEGIMALDAGADLIKVFLCAQVGGPTYIKALKAPFPNARFVDSGGGDQKTGGDFIRAGAEAPGIRGNLIPPEAIEKRDQHWIMELAARFLGIVQRAHVAPSG